MLPKENRLVRKPDFEKVKEKGEKFQSHLFGLLVYPIDNPVSRFGFVISTKLSKRAVKRNRAKRILREQVRLLLPKIKPGFDVVFLGKKALLEVTYQEIGNEIKRLFKKSGLLKD
jgi:ribonuclease P protein component